MRGVPGERGRLKRPEAIALLAIGSAALVASGVNPLDRLTWFLEVLPILIGVPILLGTRARFQFTPLAYRLVFIHCLILMVGGHYTYAEVPLGFWVQDLLDLGRNHYAGWAIWPRGSSRPSWPGKCSYARPRWPPGSGCSSW